MILGQVPPNGLYGFPTPRTMSRPDVWYPANRFAGWAIVIGAVVTLAILWALPDRFYVRPWLPLAAFIVPLLLSVAASFIYLRRFS